MATETFQGGGAQIAFVFDNVVGYQDLASAFQIGVEVHVLDASRDGLEQIAAILDQRIDVEALHVVGHGSAGALNLGSLTLDAWNVEAYGDVLGQIGGKLSANGDILLYGCDVAADAAGALFLEKVAQATGADVAASTNLTGNMLQHGDWVLEAQTGPIEAAGALTPSGQEAFAGTLAIASENFDSLGLILTPGPATELIAGSWKFTSSNPVDMAVADGVELPHWLNNDGGGSDRAAVLNFNYASTSNYTMGSADGANFKLTSFKIGQLGENQASGQSKIVTIAAYWDGHQIGAAETFNLSSSASHGGISYSYTTSDPDYGHYGTLTFNSAYADIDEIRFSFSGNATLVIDDITVGPAVPDITAPAVASVSVPSNATYLAGQNLAFTVNFNENVTVNGTDSTLGLTIGGASRSAVYASKTANSITYTYTVQVGDADADGVTVGSLSMGASTIRDAAGNNAVLTLNSVGSTTNVLVDATVPSVLGNIAVPGDDTYSVGETLSFTVTFDENVTVIGTGSTLGLNIGGASRSAAYTSKTANSITYTYTVQAGDADADGVAVTGVALNGDTIRDATGNDASLTLTGHLPSTAGILVDALAPNAPTAPDLTAGSDTGVSSTDNITKNTTPTVTGTAEANSTVTLYDTDGTTALGTTTADGSGVWSITSSTLSAGAHTLTAKAADAAGNISAASSGLAVTIDTTAPAAPSAPDLTAGSDTGASSTDNITGDTTPTLAGTAAANAIVTLYDTDGTTVLGTTTADGSGDWTITSSTLSAGAHTLTAKAADAAGNVSAAGPGLAVTIDTTAPAAPSAPDLTAGSDTGASSTDNITKNTTPTFTGTAEANSTVTLYDTNGTTVLGTATADGSGVWSITSSTLSVGAHTLTAKAADAAGNVSATGAGLAVTIDTTAPVAPSAPDLTAGSDTGVSSTDNITGDTTPIFTGTAEANSTVTLYDTDGTTALGTATADGSGVWSITSSTLSAGAHTLTAKAADAAGNISAAGADLAVTIEAPTPPPAPDPTPSVVVVTTDGGAIMTGDAGDNLITPSGGADTVSGGSGNDTMVAGARPDSLQGNAGDDSLAGGEGADTVLGGQGDDFLHGNVGDDLLYGDKGADIVLGGQGDDFLHGNVGDDLLSGDKGADTVRGGQGDDQLFGGEGNDFLAGDMGSDTLTGGAGSDIFYSFGGAGIDLVNDFNRAEGDRVMLAPGTSYTVTAVGADVHIAMAGGGEIILTGVQLSSLTGDWITV